MLGADPPPLLEVEVRVVDLLRLHLIKEMGMVVIQGRVAVPRVQTDLQEMIHPDRVAPRPKSSRIGGIQHGEALVALSLIVAVRTAVSAT